jgi:hypothetical protein
MQRSRWRLFNMDEVLYRLGISLPSQKLIFKLASVFQWLLIFKFFRKIMHRYMPNVEDSRALPGFSAILGYNIYAKNVYLNDTVFLTSIRKSNFNDLEKRNILPTA